MAISIASVSLSDTFDIWRVKTNQANQALSRSTPNPTANTIVLRDDNGNSAFLIVDSEDVNSNNVTANNLIVNTTVDFSGAIVANTGTIQNSRILGGRLSNITIDGGATSIDAAEATITSMTVTGAIDFEGAIVSNLGEIRDGSFIGGTIGEENTNGKDVIIQRGNKGINNGTAAYLKYLYVQSESYNTGTTENPVIVTDPAFVDFTGANVTSLGTVGTINLRGGLIENTNVIVRDSGNYIRANCEVTLQNNAIFTAETSALTTSDYLTLVTHSATTGKILNIVDDSESNQERVVTQITQDSIDAKNSTALNITARGGKPLVVANNTSDILTIFQNGDVLWNGNVATVNTVNYYQNDPVIQINNGGLDVDTGILLKSSDESGNSYGIFWDRSDNLLVFAETDNNADTVRGDITFGDDKYLNFKANTFTARGNLNVEKTSILNILNVEGVSTFTDVTNFIHPVNASNTVTVTGESTFSNTVTVTGKSTFSNTVTVNSSSTFNSSVLITSTLTTDLSSTFNNTVSFTSEDQAVSATSAAVTFDGGIGIAKNVRVGGKVYESSSLVLKENIYPIENSLNLINSLTGVYYDWKDNRDDGRQIGLIAEEVQKVLPEASDGTAVAYTKLVGLLVQGIKDLSKKVTQLEDKIKG